MPPCSCMKANKRGELGCSLECSMHCGLRHTQLASSILPQSLLIMDVAPSHNPYVKTNYSIELRAEAFNPPNLIMLSLIVSPVGL